VTGTFDSAGVPIRFVEGGSGVPVVLVHSYGGDLQSQWVETGVFDALAQEFRTIAFDCRGHGASGKPHETAAYGVQIALDAVRLLDHLAIARAHVVGYSMGAHLVALLLTIARERFLSATLAGGTGRRRWSAEHERQAQIEADEMEHGSLATQMRRLSTPGAPVPSADVIARSSATFLEGKDRYALAAARRSNREQVFATEALARVDVPVLGIVGSEDPYLASYAELAAVMPQMKLVTIEGADHASAVGAPQFIAALAAFLRSVR
jgi:pimeloyl-ACP methyl ester carboxylesterase